MCPGIAGFRGLGFNLWIGIHNPQVQYVGCCLNQCDLLIQGPPS